MAQPIGIIGGRPEDVSLLRNTMHIHAVRHIASMNFYRGTIGRSQVVLCQSGVGKVNAALAAQIMIDRFRVRAIIGTGIAGSLQARIQVGSIVIGTKSQQHDVDFTALCYPPGVIPGMKTSVFSATPVWIQRAYRAAGKLGFKANRGKVLSGDEFIASRTAAKSLRQTFGGLCVDSIGAGAIGQAAYKNHISYTVVRGISDRAGFPPSKNFQRNARIASLKSQLVVLTMLVPNFQRKRHVSGA